MAVDWTPHRFSGGILALDVTNTVVRRDRPDLCFDRFEDAGEIARFAKAASVQREAELGGQALRVADGIATKPIVVALREATDALFRDAASHGRLREALLAPFLRATADIVALSPLEVEMGGSPEGIGEGFGPPSRREPPTSRLRSPAQPLKGSIPPSRKKPGPPLRFETALGLSALSLLPPEAHRRIRICPNCAWLFLDRSRNRSRTWCDMAVCGNRAKAARHRGKHGMQERPIG